MAYQPIIRLDVWHSSLVAASFTAGFTSTPIVLSIFRKYLAVPREMYNLDN